jgi:hypothetical protein
MKKIIIALFFLLVTGYVYSSDGGSSATFLRMGGGAKGSSMGEAYSAVTESADSIYYNPASMVFAKSSLSFNHMAYIESTYYDTLYYSKKVNEKSAFGAGVQYFSYGSVDETDPSGTKVGSYSPKDMALTFAYSLKINSKYSILDNGGVGLSLKYINTKVKDSASAFAADIGFITPVMKEKFRAAFVVQNLGTKMKFDEEKEKLPLVFKTGFSYTPLKELLTSLDFVFPNDSDFYFSVGSAYRKKFDFMNLVLRAGYNGVNKNVEGFSGFNFGLGFEFNKLSVDYSFMPYGDMGSGHRIGFSFAF